MELKLPWLLVVCFGCLSVYNFLRDLEADSRFISLEEKSADHGRHRRDTGTENWQNILNLDTLKEFVQKHSNETFQREITHVLGQLMLNFPADKLCKNFMIRCGKDKCTEEKVVIAGDQEIGNKGKTKCIRGPPGPQGPPGPRGPKGSKGLGLEPPKLVQNSLGDRVVNLTDSTTFECTFFGNPIPTISWRSVANNGRVSSTVDKEKSEITTQLTLKNISWNDQGPVECRAKSLLGEDYGSGNLSTLLEPVIHMTETLVFAPNGVNFQLPECKVRSNPTATVTWKRIFWSMPVGRFNVQENKLMINNVRYSDEGFYVCEAENYLGKDKKTVQLKVKGFEMYHSSPSYIASMTTDTTNVTCSAYGNTKEMTGTISKSGRNIPVVIEKREDNLFVVAAEITEDGTYVCTIEYGKEKVESASVVEFFTLQSKIFNSTQIETIRSWLDEAGKLGKYEPCFTLSTPSTNFYQPSYCGDKSNTISLMQVKDKLRYGRDRYGRYRYDWGSIYGGFTDIPWNRYSSRASNSTFIFDLNQMEKYPLRDTAYARSNAVCYYNGYGPCFGSTDLYVRSGSLGNKGRWVFQDVPSIQTGREVRMEVFYKV
ncbi:uncharacterized protein [Clytia hemisphaerica]|uniref:Ig-like domain-containing protein n=1 Tax=Clytia hemisphaerica TaxID=252671 RepID=A0A7M5XBB3_9CNID